MNPMSCERHNTTGNKIYSELQEIRVKLEGHGPNALKHFAVMIPG